MVEMSVLVEVVVFKKRDAVILKLPNKNKYSWRDALNCSYPRR